MDSGDESPLSSAPESDIELEPEQPTSKKSLNRKRKRPESPVREPTLADTFEIAFIVGFVSRFGECFKGAPSIGCQDIEQGIVNTVPSDKVEYLLCRLLSLVLNRKKPVEKGHYNRALEEAIAANKSQWPLKWEGISPLAGGKTFEDLDIMKRLDVLRTLVLWSMAVSEQVRTLLSTYYKNGRKSGDVNNPLAVQVWGLDGLGRRYYMIEGTDDTKFRVFRENPAHLKTVQWLSVAGNLEELNGLAARLDIDGSKNARILRSKILQAVPRLEEGERKRQRREYRQSRKAAWTYQAGLSLYEGRTRGKRIKYNYSSDESGAADGARSTRKSERNRQPSEQSEGPQFTASGRQIRKPATGSYGETITNGAASHGHATGRTTRNSGETANGYEQYAEGPDTRSPSEGQDYDEYKGTDGDDESDDSEYEKREGPLVVTLKIGGSKLSEIANGETRYDYSNNTQLSNGSGTVSKEWKGDVLAPDAMDIDKTDTTADAEREKENTAPDAHDTPTAQDGAVAAQETG
ncbi:hypothetical protein BJ508DRAFT_410799 [Ascobolus immersus RN42]|uniref:WHIM1 domain-containing protein n=1 Tax=Ascobolus immersus RN42 TaxID=1160509 RepID=A0A3N4IST0_ASCIM|nr:hypothetical protein BJ508DRAFT_410799 [Ascobolus immersus RN42]